MLHFIQHSNLHAHVRDDPSTASDSSGHGLELRVCCTISPYASARLLQGATSCHSKISFHSSIIIGTRRNPARLAPAPCSEDRGVPKTNFGLSQLPCFLGNRVRRYSLLTGPFESQAQQVCVLNEPPNQHGALKVVVRRYAVHIHEANISPP